MSRHYRRANSYDFYGRPRRDRDYEEVDVDVDVTREPCTEDYRGRHVDVYKEDTHGSHAVRRVKVSGTKKRIITSSANAPDQEIDIGIRPRHAATLPYGSHYIEGASGEPRVYRSRDYYGSRRSRRPTYSKVKREHISETTLAYYQIPYKVDDEPAYLIILREMDQRELDILFEHTRRLRGKQRSPSPRVVSRRPRSRTPSKASSQRRTRSRTRSAALRLDSEAEILEVIEGESKADEFRTRPDPPGESHGSRASDAEEENEDRDENADSDEQGDDVETIFDFTFLPIMGNSSKGSVELDETSSDFEAVLLSRHPPGRNGGPLLDKYVTTSTWSGSTFEDSGFGAKVHVSSSPPSRSMKAMLRWLHLERAMPSFDEFASAVESVLVVSAKEKRHVRDMLRKLQRDNEQQRQHGREMKAFCEADLDIEGLGEEARHTSSICAISIPFFSLEKTSVNQSRSIPAGSSEHPSRPLLQMHTRIMNEKRELSQAITQFAPQGHYLHVAGLWCVISNQNTLITCSKLPLTQLGKDISFVNESNERPTEHYVNLRAGSTRAWRFPKCISHSLPSLLSMLVDRVSDLVGSSPEVELKYRSRPVKFASWKGLLESSSNADLELVLHSASSRHYGRSSKNHLMSFLKAIPGFGSITRRGGSIVNDFAAKDSEKPHATTIDEVNAQAEPLVSAQHLKIYSCSLEGSAGALATLATGMHQSLISVGQKSVRDSYARCAEASAQDVEKWIYDPSAQGERNALLRRKLLIAQISQHIVGFFWPADFDHITIRKFRGATLTLLESEGFRPNANVTEPRARIADVDAAQKYLDDLCEQIYEFVYKFTTTFTGYESALVALPEQFYMAWPYLASAFTLAAMAKDTRARHNYLENPTYQLRQAGEMLKEGERILTTRLRKDDIEDFEVCSSRGIVALVLDSVTRDMMSGRPDVPQSYDDYCKQLEARIVADPLSRAHQQTLRELQQEVEAITSVLKQQLEVLTYFESSIKDLDEERLPDLPMLRTSRQDLVLRQCKANINSRLDLFEALQGRAIELGEWLTSEIETNKDRQEAAIMVFTIVTIIFLPLSFVSGVFGMNTNDVRNMTQGQWAYWAAAVPLTVVVVGVSMWFAGAFDNANTWLSRTATKKSSTLQQTSEPVVMGTGIAQPRSYHQEKSMLYSAPRRRTTYPVKQYM